MKKTIIALLLTFVIGGSLSAQDQKVFGQFFMNPYIYNPAYVGVEGHSAVFGMYRKQWIGINGAPQLSHFNFHTPLEDGLAIGAMAYNESEGPLSNSGIKATVGYLIAVDKKHYLRFGMSVGGGYSTINIQPGNDQTLQNLNTTSHIMADFGVTYHIGYFNIGLSIPNLISREVISSETFSPITLAAHNNLMLKINFRSHLNDDYAIEPHLIYRYSNVNLPQYEAALIIHIKHLVWAGASFRQDAGISALVGFKVKEKIAIGFAYALSNSNLSSHSLGTAELHIGYHLGDRKHHHKHAHSFIKSHRKTKEEREQEEERKRLAAEKKATEIAQRKKEEDEKRLAKQKAIATEKATQENNNTDNDSEGGNTDELENDDSADQEGEENLIENDKKTQTDDSPIGTDTNEENSPADDSQKIVKRGNHLLELKVGYHVVAGVFAVFDHAEKRSDQLFNRGFHNVKVGYITASKRYYTVIFESDDYQTAKAELDRFKSSKALSDIWILTVE